ncbi:HAD-IA family hydrolase [Kaarinaea lacus]
MQKTFELLVFDWDGTLMDSEAHIVASMHNAVSDVGLPPLSDGSVSNVIGLGLKEAIETILPGIDEDTYRSVFDRYRYHFLADDPTSPFEGAEAVLSELNEAGYLLAVATGKGRPGLERVLEMTGFGQYFVETRCADETRSKPHPQMLHEIMDVLGVTPDKTLMIGDTEYDLQMAHSAGVAPLAVDYGVHDRERLMGCNPLGYLMSIKELPGWLMQHSLKSKTKMVS